MSVKKELFVSAVKLLSIDGDRTVPTVVDYQNGKVRVGTDALEGSSYRDDFKVELGERDPASQARTRVSVGASQVRSPLGMTRDFCDENIKKIKKLIEFEGQQFPNRVLIAEPLSLSNSKNVTETWLSNYRACMRRALHGKFEEIDFMPEPFAVFQYYRYGIKHPLIAEKQKHIALVIDFGGGTFDVSVIETTAEGDISQSGRNSRPLSASSIAVGGFYINRAIADDILFSVVDKKADKQEIRKNINKFIEEKNSDPDDLRDDVKNFFINYRSLLHSVEIAKVSICSGIANWDLSANLGNAIAFPVRTPVNPCSANPNWTEVRLDAEKIREIFQQRIWKQKLQPAIESGLKRASQELDGKPISIVLLSGGSSNIRWLTSLLERDLRPKIGDAQILELSDDFQEIVAKGLAVECARRYYTAGASDFRAVTYNRLCLSLNPNSDGAETRKFRCTTHDAFNNSSENGVLLPSASSLRGLIDTPIRWRTKLSKAPTRNLDYYFLRSSFDPEDLENLQNVMDKTVSTPPQTKFGSSIDIELIVREDGTAIPCFIYGQIDRHGFETRVEGRPFALDMTFASEEVQGETYLGFDFGTSTSAFSYVDNRDVREYTKRSKEKNWTEITDLIQELPYPIAHPLASFVAETSEHGISKFGREVIEAMLCMTAYTSYSLYCASSSKLNTHLLKGFENRSAGPLWDLLKRLSRTRVKSHAFRSFMKLTEEPFFDEIDHVVNEIAQEKHGKKPKDIDYPRVISLIGNQLTRIFAKNFVGYFEDVKGKPFSAGKYKGIFRCAVGPNAPFSKLFNYEGPVSIPPGWVYLVNPDDGSALNLSPLFLSGLKRLGSTQAEEIHCFDKFRRKDNTFDFKATQEDEGFEIDVSGDFSEIHDLLTTIRDADQEVENISGISIELR
ncbi:hypothetical protein T8K17_22700 [Thalassobaculum sp. OXR-137]|uniref:Hsp70 family protein n=1 Tax=Thalassobaculum sp. OXR-137 TaxID=3100173 RepID=UPI002AC954C8|nr:hypothetical protein [Thalassobaculum sp. OXR-137]WPZ34035.1 hypothetical protein T8K17_22700 [Thalassobaculum sp. OXR-137]